MQLLKLPLDFFLKRKNGEVLSRLSDINSIRSALSGMTVGVILDCVMLLFVGVVLFMFSPRLVFIAMIPVIISGIMVILFSNTFKRLIYSKAKIEAEKYSHFVESINGISTIKALSTEEDSYDKAEDEIALEILSSRPGRDPSELKEHHRLQYEGLQKTIRICTAGDFAVQRNNL